MAIIESSTLSELAEKLRGIVGPDGVLSNHAELVVYECDGFVIEKNSPDVVVFPAHDRGGGRGACE